MVLAQRQKHISMEQNRKPRDKSMHLWTSYLCQMRQEYTMEKRHLFNKWCWENWYTTCKRMKLEHFLTPYRRLSAEELMVSNCIYCWRRLLRVSWTERRSILKDISAEYSLEGLMLKPSGGQSIGAF